MPKKIIRKWRKPRFKTLSFLSDFGYEDEFVGITKSVIYEIAPFAQIVDITHNISPHNIRAGALLLARSAGYLSPGLVLAVVDPGVGSDRRAIAVEVGGGSSILVGPDNGLLAPAVAIVGGASRVVEITSEHYRLPALGATFAARDIFAPAAAHLMKGLELKELGEEIDPNSLTPQLIPIPRTLEDGGIMADVLWIDRFGNVQLNLEKKDFEMQGFDTGSKVQLRHKDSVRTLQVVENYATLNQGELGLAIDSYGLAAIVAAKSSAHLELDIKEGDEVQLKTITEIL